MQSADKRRKVCAFWRYHGGLCIQQQPLAFALGVTSGEEFRLWLGAAGFIPTNMLSQTSYSQVMARQAEIKQEQGTSPKDHW